MSPKFVSSLVCILFAGCVGVAKFPIVEPISFRPSGTNAQRAVEVHTLQPTFTWKPAAGVSSYDLAIWRIGPGGAPGEIEYYAENIEETRHTPAKVLLPGEYFWSVKAHDSTVWVTVNFTQVNPLYIQHGTGWLFRIKVSAN